MARQPHPGRADEEDGAADGVFGDDNGDHAAGTYLRNPRAARTRRSRARAACFSSSCASSRSTTYSRCESPPALNLRHGLVPGLRVMPLHEHDGISTALVRWAPDTQFHGRWCTEPRSTSSALCRLRFTLGSPNDVRSWALRRRACN